jgi:hypothetical protein
MQEQPFTESLEEYKGLYYHFLDGYLNPNSGNHQIKYINMFNKNDEILKDTIIESKSSNILSFFLYDDNYSKINCLMYTDDQFRNRGNLNIKYIIKLFFLYKSYNILNINHNKHSTCLLFSIEENQLLISCVNSGLGIDKFPQFFKNDNFLFNRFILLEDYTNKEETFKLSSILHIPSLYYALINISHYIIQPNDKMIKFILNETIKEYISDIKILLDYLGLTFNSIGFIVDFGGINILDSTNYDQEFTYYNNSNILSYYEIIMNILIKLKEKKINIGSKFNDLTKICLNENIKDNIIFHNLDGELYYKPQQSGSCSWFSLYWSLLYYNIHINNEEQYYKLIQNIYDFYYKKMEEIFIHENFNKENENFLLMKIICQKLLDLNLLKDKQLLENNIDFIYDDFYIGFDYIENIKLNNNIENNQILSNIREIQNNDSKIEYIFNNILFYYYDLNNLGGIYLEFKNTEFFILSYELYKYSIKIGKPLLKKYIDFNIILEKIKHIKTYNVLLSRFENLNKLIDERTNHTDSKNFRYISECKHIINYCNTNKQIEICDDYILNYSIFLNELKLFTDIYKINLIFFTKNSPYVSEDDKESYNFFLQNILLLNNFTTNDLKIDTFILRNYHRNNLDFFCLYNRLPGLVRINYLYLVYPLDYKTVNKLPDYCRTYEDFQKLIIFLFNNPKYIFTNFNNDNYFINNCNFIKFNIYEIFKEPSYRDNLIIFFASKYYDLHELEYDNKEIELFFIIANLQLLITKYLGYFNFESSPKLLDYKFTYYYNVYECCKIDFLNFRNVIDREYIKFKKEGKKKFCNYLKDNKDKLFESNLILLKKYFTDIKIKIDEDDDTTIIELDKIDYKLINPSKTLRLNIFNVNNETLFLKKINPKEHEIYIISYEYKIKLILEKKKGSIYKINKIFLNDIEVIKYKDLNEAFKYVIPTNCVHLITKINDEYNILYFVNNEYTSTSDILGKCSLFNQTYKISINKNNLMFPNKDCFEIFSKLCVNFHINKFNIVYLNENMFNEIETFLCYNKKVNQLFNFNKKLFLKGKLNNCSEYIKLHFFKNINKIGKFLFKISRCEPFEYNKILNKLEHYINICECNKDNFQIYIKDKNMKYLFENYSELYNYLFSIKIINFLTILKNIIKNKDKDYIINFCSQSKIFKDYFNTKEYSFNYNFEALFELIVGNELLEEQMERYIKIIKKYKEYDGMIVTNLYNNKNYSKEYDILYDQSGGNYPLHHFMMGKGKSAIMTPILSLYFSIIHNKNIIIIVPTHLEKQTYKTMDDIIHIFDLSNQVKILTDSTIKKYFLADVFSNRNNSDTIMLIDEFDSILDPMKSNFNIINDKTKSTNLLFNLLKPNFDKSIEEQIDFIKSCNINHGILSDIKYEDIVKTELKLIKEQLDHEILIENINWGIHPLKGYAIPFRSKGNPLVDSNFSSSILTVYLTLYYYLVIKNYELNEIICNYIIFNSLLDKVFNINEPPIITNEFVNEIFTRSNKMDFFYKLLTHIFSTIDVPINRYNSSFIDILNINGIFKIGYSGTINIDLPPLSNQNKFILNNIEEDPDESTNIEYAILNSNSFLYNKEKNIFEITGLNLNNYSAIIDTVGFFKNELNEHIAKKIYDIFSGTRDVIFIDENDNIYVFKNDLKIIYDSNYPYINPFIYYSQSHIIGIDIKQDNYPIMKGLCIIDEYSYYSQIAQAMFRLRKLNMGHSIDFINLKKYREKEEIICYLRENEDNNKKNKNKYLLYQTLKTELRSKKIINTEGNTFSKINKIIEKEKNKLKINYNEHHLEKIKYYYIDFKSEPRELLFGIINISDIDTPENKQLFESIKESLKILVYNINSLEQEQEQEQEQEKDKSNQKELLYNLNPNDIIDMSYFDIEYIKYDFTLIKQNYTEFIKNTFKISDMIRCLPNLFSQVDTYNFVKNKSAFLFVYIHGLLLLIPGYLFIHFNDDYPLLTLNFTFINKIIIDKELLECLKHNDIYTIFTSNEQIELNYNFETCISLLMLSILQNITKYQHDILINPRILALRESIYTFFARFMKTITDKSIFLISTNTIDNINCFNKYLKYKLKYLKL